MRGAPTQRRRDFFVCSYVASSFDPLRTEKTSDFGVESRDPAANLCPSSKIPDFFRRRRGGIEKEQFSGWMFCVLSFSSVAYIEVRTSDLHAKSMDYSADVVDVPWGGVTDPTNNRTPIGDHQTSDAGTPLSPVTCTVIGTIGNFSN